MERYFAVPGIPRKVRYAFTDEDKSVRPSLFLCRDPAKENFLLGALGVLAVDFYENKFSRKAWVGCG